MHLIASCIELGRSRRDSDATGSQTETVGAAETHRTSDPQAPYLSGYIGADMEWEPAGPAAVEGSVYRGRVDVFGAMAALWVASKRRGFATSVIRSSGWGAFR
jgi:hypothetical protein